MTLGKAADQRGYVTAAEAQGGIDSQQPARAALSRTQGMFKIIDLGQDPPRVAQEGLALDGEAHASCGSIDQLHPSPDLELGESLADSGRAHREFASRRGQASCIRQRNKKSGIRGLNDRIHGDRLKS